MSQMSQGRISSPESGGTGGPDLEQLEHLVAENAASPLFPALAETHRFAGRLDEARRVAEAGLEEAPENSAGRLVLALTLLDMGQVDAARRQLAQGLFSLGVAPAVPRAEGVRATDAEEGEGAAVASESGHAGAELADSEIDYAFESAEAQPDEMLDANKLVEQALRREDLLEPEGGASPVPPTFATKTMAELLERQGDLKGATAIRASIEGVARGLGLEAAAAPARGVADPAASAESELEGPVERTRILATLESWLHNIRRGMA